MRRHDPLAPGERVDGRRRARTSRRSAHAFNEMLDRLESERRESARRALMVQEGERQPDRARAARRGRPDADRRDASGRRPRREDPRRAARASSTSCAKPHAAAPRTSAGSRAQLRPEALEDLGLQSALGGAGDGVRRAGRRPRSSAGSSPRLPLSEEQELVVYRVAQEALTNVARHAARDRASSSQLRQRPTRVVLLIVRDDGRGLTPRAALPRSRHPRHARARDAHRRAADDRPTARRRHRGPAPSPSTRKRTDDDVP